MMRDSKEAFYELMYQNSRLYTYFWMDESNLQRLRFTARMNSLGRTFVWTPQGGKKKWNIFY